MSSSNQELLPPPPYIGIRPPKDIATHARSKVVYGFPLSYEWLKHRYHHEVELEASPGAPVEDKYTYVVNFTHYISRVCWKIHRVKCIATMVETSREHGKGQTMFLVVSYPGLKPPPETLKTLIDRVADYGIVEKPGWYLRL